MGGGGTFFFRHPFSGFFIVNVLVTGGAGYIGSHTAKLLRREGHLPVVVDNLDAGHAEFARFGPFVQGDLRDETLVYETLTTHRIDAVIHFAAKALVEESVAWPEAYFSHNVGGTISLLSAMKRAGTPKLVFSSSCAVYGDCGAEAVAEDHSKLPTNPYGLSKLQSEQIIASVGKTFALRTAVLRYFNVIGADDEGELWEWHEPETHVLPNLLQAAREEVAFQLFGTDHPTPDGTAVRDYVDVRDLATVHL